MLDERRSIRTDLDPMETQAMQFRDDPDHHRYVADDDGRVAGQAVYRPRGGRVLFVHTEVDDAYAGQGVATGLVEFALDDVRARGAMVVPLCPFVAAYIERHPEYEDLVDHEMLDQIDRRRTAP